MLACLKKNNLSLKSKIWELEAKLCLEEEPNDSGRGISQMFSRQVFQMEILLGSLLHLTKLRVLRSTAKY